MVHEVINPEEVTRADIAVFIPSYQEADNIALPTKKAAAGLKKFYPDLSSVIVNCDNGSGDGTRTAFFEAECEVPRVYVSTPPGIRGKGANLRNIFQLAADFSARVVVVVDANLISIKTTWIKSLVEPVLAGSAEYVAPLYVRHRHDAPISQALAYPLTRSLFGRRVLQPICVDHAFSGRLNEIFRQRAWEIDDRGYKSDLGLLSTAIIHQAPICQSFMAHPRVTTLGSLDYDLSKAFSYVAGALFTLMLETWDFWSQVKRSRPTILAGVNEAPMNPAPLVEVDRDYLLASFIDCGREFRGVWVDIFSPPVLAAVERELTTAVSGGLPTMPIDLWCRVICEAALAFKTAGPNFRLDLAGALGPLFCVKNLTSSLASETMTERQYNAALESEALSFEMAKATLVEAWTAGVPPDEGNRP